MFKNLKKLPGELKALIEKRIELFTIEVGERITNLIAHAFYRLSGIILLALGLILILFAASNFIGGLLESEALGFLVVAIPVLLLGILLFIRRPRFLVKATRDKMLTHFLKDLSEQLNSIDTEEESEPDEKSASGVNKEESDHSDSGSYKESEQSSKPNQ
ncbi:MAG: phage holin family protein [Balneolales bacterium]